MIGLSVHIIKFFNAFSMVIQKLVSPKNDHFSLKLYITTSNVRLYGKIIFEIISLLYIAVSHFFEIIHGRLFIVF